MFGLQASQDKDKEVKTAQAKAKAHANSSKAKVAQKEDKATFVFLCFRDIFCCMLSAVCCVRKKSWTDNNNQSLDSAVS
jgi:hypothetical protein